ncbi:MAG: rhodanese-like domain-containing protein [Halopseudomonas sp.]
MDMIFHQIATQRGCQSYLIGCRSSCTAIVVDPELSLLESYQALAAKEGLRIHYALDTHTHADHFSATQALATQLQVPVIMHRASPAPFVTMHVDDGEMLIVGTLRLEILHTPGHTADSICVKVEDRLLTGDTLLLGGTGRTDLPSGDPNQLYDSLFDRLLRLDPATKVFPAHIYSERSHSTLAHEIANNPRLQKRERGAFVEQMNSLNLEMPTHLTEALRTNLSGGKAVSQLIAEAAGKVPFMSLEQVLQRTRKAVPDILLLDVRETEAYKKSHIPTALHIPRGQLELRVNDQLADPTQRIVVYCQFGKISTLAAATLKELGFDRAVALDGGLNAWQEKGYPLTSE